MAAYPALQRLRESLDHKPRFKDIAELASLNDIPETVALRCTYHRPLALQADMEIDSTFKELNPEHLLFAVRQITSRVFTLAIRCERDVVSGENEGNGDSGGIEANSGDNRGDREECAWLAYDLTFKMIDSAAAAIVKATAEGWEIDGEYQKYAQAVIGDMYRVWRRVQLIAWPLGGRDISRDLDRLRESWAVFRSTRLTPYKFVNKVGN